MERTIFRILISIPLMALTACGSDSDNNSLGFGLNLPVANTSFEEGQNLLVEYSDGLSTLSKIEQETDFEGSISDTGEASLNQLLENCIVQLTDTDTSEQIEIVDSPGEDCGITYSKLTTVNYSNNVITGTVSSSFSIDDPSLESLSSVKSSLCSGDFVANQGSTFRIQINMSCDIVTQSGESFNLKVVSVMTGTQGESFSVSLNGAVTKGGQVMNFAMDWTTTGSESSISFTVNGQDASESQGQVNGIFGFTQVNI